MGLRLQNMRDRRKDKGVKVCPTVNMSEVKFLEPVDEEGEEKDSDDSADEPLNKKEVETMNTRLS